MTKARIDWEEARDRENELALEVTRKEGDRNRLVERLTDQERSLGEASGRLESLGSEETVHESEVAAAEKLREEGAEATEDLFKRRGAAVAELRLGGGAAGRVGDSLPEAER